eukprot:CAMPEP_0170311288 /NCGR_PEP_ID=MMETSP0116_2-20130129/56148_1 /TAXON_ID=400756 /ORGANISM="Durinskia baltica, Strain CSIRO CS-38" /LENGTH=109 /DNA_ID=CAMNT_0010563599 /DNA_START=63 /DNA_END=389 /DNA_ORIENTATION=+
MDEDAQRSGEVTPLLNPPPPSPESALIEREASPKRPRSTGSPSDLLSLIPAEQQGLAQFMQALVQPIQASVAVMREDNKQLKEEVGKQTKRTEEIGRQLNKVEKDTHRL